MYLAVAALEVALHWYAGAGHGPAAMRVHAAYFYRDPVNHKPYVAGIADLVIPAILCGAALGTFGAMLPPRVVVIGVIVLSLGIVGLFPLYASCFRSDGLRWWSAAGANGGTTVELFKAFIKALALCGVSTYGAQQIGRYFQQYEIRNSAEN